MSKLLVEYYFKILILIEVYLISDHIILQARNVHYCNFKVKLVNCIGNNKKLEKYN